MSSPPNGTAAIQRADSLVLLPFYQTSPPRRAHDLCMWGPGPHNGSASAADPEGDNIAITLKLAALVEFAECTTTKRGGNDELAVNDESKKERRRCQRHVGRLVASCISQQVLRSPFSSKSRPSRVVA